MRWALVFHPEHEPFYLHGQIRLQPMEIPEDRIAVAVAQGWIVLVTDTEVFETPMVDVPAQSNPRRLLDEPRDYGEQ